MALLGGALLFSCGLTVAQELPEAKLLACRAAGDFRGAGDACLQLLDRLAGGGSTAADAALAELAAAMALDLERYAPRGPEVAARVLAAAGGRLAQGQPLLADRLRLLAMDDMARRGDPAAPALAAQCGVLGDVWLIGPFDNERGSGFARDAGPEQAFAPDQHYDGKRRPQAWRHLPEAAPDGILPLGQLLRPDSQVMAYVATAVIAKADVDAALCLGSSGSFRVWLNGAELGARDVQRRFARDQDALLLPLRKGSNLLLLKFCQQEGAEFVAAARLRGLAGEVLDSVRCSSDQDDLLAAAAVAPRPLAEPPVPSLGAVTTFLQEAKAGDGVAALRAAALLLMSHPDDDTDDRLLALTRQAAAALPQSPVPLVLQARARVRQVASKADRDENLRRADLAAALQLRPDDVEALLQQGWLEASATRMSTRVEALAERVLELAPQCALGHMMLADALRGRDEGQLALRQLQLAAASGAAPLFVWQRLAEQADDIDDLDLLQVARERAAALGDLDERLALARLRLRLGETDAGRAMLQAAIAAEPLMRAPRATLAGLQAASGDVAGALQTWAAWLALCPEDDAALVEVAALHRRNGDAEKQLAALHAALELNPNLREVSRYVEFLAAETTPFYAAFQLDGKAVLDADAGPPADAAAAKDPLFHVLQQRVVRAFRNGTTSEYLHLITRVLTEDGARSLQRYWLPYHRGDQRGRLLACVVRKADGSLQRPRLRGAGVDLAGLQPGDVVEIEGRVDDLAPTFFGDYFGLEHRFAARDGSPVASSMLVVVADPGRAYQCQAQNGAPEPAVQPGDGGTTVYRWQMQALPRDVPEPNRPSWKEREPLVRMTTYRDWDHFAGWWWNLIERQLEMTPAMRQKVAELCQGLPDVEAKIAAIYRFVTTEVRYEAWEFGVHGYKPYSTAVIFERRHGDCKDKALLLAAMLGEIGVRAEPVLIWAEDERSQSDLSLPLVSHFNHCIAWLPPQDGRDGRFLDGTASWHPPDTLPAMDQGARVLVVDRGKAELRQVPWADPEHNLTDQTFAAALRADGSAEVRIDLQPRGNEAIGLRATLGTEPARRQEQLERWLLPLLGKATLRDIEASDALRLEQPVSLRAVAEVTGLATRQGGDLLLKDAFVRTNLLALTGEPQRHTPLLLGPPSTERQLVRYRLPAGFSAPGLPAPVQLQTPFGSFTLQWTRQGDELVARRELVLRAPRVQVAEYPAFRDFAAAVRAADDRRVVARQEGGR